MRFRVRDLLLATTAVAIYAAVFAYVFQQATNKDLSRGADLAFGGFFGMTVVCSVFTAYSRARVGRKLVSWQMQTTGVQIILPPAALLVLIAFPGLLLPHSNLNFPVALNAAAQCVVWHGFLIANNQFIVGRNGIRYGMGFFAWDACRIRLSEDEKHISFRLMNPKLLDSRKAKKTPVPPEKLTEVRKALASVAAD